jgi:hypothetical protein
MTYEEWEPKWLAALEVIEPKILSGAWTLLPDNDEFTEWAKVNANIMLACWFHDWRQIPANAERMKKISDFLLENRNAS